MVSQRCMLRYSFFDIFRAAYCKLHLSKMRAPDTYYGEINVTEVQRPIKKLGDYPQNIGDWREPYGTCIIPVKVGAVIPFLLKNHPLADIFFKIKASKNVSSGLNESITGTPGAKAQNLNDFLAIDTMTLYSSVGGDPLKRHDFQRCR